MKPKSKLLRKSYRVDMLTIGSNVFVNYYQSEDLAMCKAIAESLRRGKTGGRLIELSTDRVLAKWDGDSPGDSPEIHYDA